MRVPAMEITGAYSALWDDVLSEDGGDGFLEAGWMLSLCGNLNRSLGVVGEVSGHYGSDELLDAVGAPLARRTGTSSACTPACATRTGATASPCPTSRPSPAGRAPGSSWPAGGWSRTPSRSSPGWASSSGCRGAWASASAPTTASCFGEDESRNELRLHAGLVLGDRGPLTGRPAALV